MTTVTLGFDVEEFDFPMERGREIDFDTQLAVSTEGLTFILQLLNRMKLKATFYTTANFAIHRPEIVKTIVSDGHEIASHDYYHSVTANSDIIGSKRTLEDITGTDVVGYRAPRLAVAQSTALKSAGYLYNSSINPTWIPGRYNNIFKPRTISKEDGLIIYPTSVASPFRVPLFWIALHVFPLGMYKFLAKTALSRDKHLNLYFHPWEFSTRLSEPAFNVPHYISHCSGLKLQMKFEQLLQWLVQCGYSFDTTREYLGL